MEVEGVEKPRERVAHRSGQNSSSAPVTAATGTQEARGSITCSRRKITLMSPAAANTYCCTTNTQLTDKQASATKAPTAEPIDEPGICC